MASCANMGEASARMESKKSRFMNKASGLLNIDGRMQEISLARTRKFQERQPPLTSQPVCDSSASISRAAPQVDRDSIRGSGEGFKTNRDAQFDYARGGCRGIGTEGGGLTMEIVMRARPFLRPSCHYSSSTTSGVRPRQSCYWAIPPPARPPPHTRSSSDRVL